MRKLLFAFAMVTLFGASGASAATPGPAALPSPALVEAANPDATAIEKVTYWYYGRRPYYGYGYGYGYRPRYYGYGYGYRPYYRKRYYGYGYYPRYYGYGYRPYYRRYHYY